MARTVRDSPKHEMNCENPMKRRQGILRAGMVGALTLLMSWAVVAADATKLPSFTSHEPALVKLCASAGLERTDIISKSNAAAMLDALAKQGWNVANRDKLLERVLPDNDFLVAELRSKQGKNFVRQIISMPDGLDRVDRMSRQSQGKYVINMLVTHVDGPKMIGYMTGPTSNPRLSNLLSAAPPGADLNRPTGRLYTVDDFLNELKKLHAAAIAGT